MAYLAKLARADAIAVVLQMKGAGYVTYVAHNLPAETKWSDGRAAVMLARAMTERVTDQATSGVTVALADGRLAELVGLELAEANALWRAQRQQQDAEATLKASRDLQAIIRHERDPDQLLERTTAQLADVFGADGVSIMLANAQGELSVRSSRGLSDAAKQDRKRIGEGISGRVAQTGKPILLSGQVQGGSDPTASESMIVPLRSN